MRVIRLFAPYTLVPESELELDGVTHHYAVNVLRVNKHSKLVIFNGDGFDYSCEILAISKSTLKIKILGKHFLDNESPINIHLYLGISKSSHMDYAIQKTVEAGVNTIHPILMERSVIKATDKSLINKHQHWQRIVQSACEQSGRAVIPCLSDTCEPNDIDPISPSESGLMFNACAQRTLEIISDKKVLLIKLLIGPEGGLTNNEIELMLEKGFQAVRCGPRVLRTETAAITAVTAVQLLAGDLLN